MGVTKSVVRRLERLEEAVVPIDPYNDMPWIHWRGAAVRVLRTHDVDTEAVIAAIDAKASREGCEDETAGFSPAMAKWFWEAIQRVIVALPDVQTEFITAVNRVELRFFGRKVTEKDNKEGDKITPVNEIGG